MLGPTRHVSHPASGSSGTSGEPPRDVGKAVSSGARCSPSRAGRRGTARAAPRGGRGRLSRAGRPRPAGPIREARFRTDARKCVVLGKRVSVVVDLGGRCNITKKHTMKHELNGFVVYIRET